MENTSKLYGIEELPYRPIEVAGQELKVPRHVVRIDIYPKPGSRKCVHGWQVRYNGSTKYFNDRIFGSPEGSLAAAIKHLDSIYAGEVLKVRTQEHANKAEKLGMTGIRIRRIASAKTGATGKAGKTRISNVRVYAEVKHPMTGMPPKSVFIGNDDEVTPALIKVAVEQASAIRQEMLQTFVEFRRAVPACSPNNTLEAYKAFASKAA